MDSVYEGSVLSEDDTNQTSASSDARLTWFASQVLTAFRGTAAGRQPMDFLESEEYLGPLARFISSGSIGSCLYVAEGPAGKLISSDKRPAGRRGTARVVSFTRAVGGELRHDEYMKLYQQVLVSDVAGGLGQVERVTRSILLPSLRASGGLQGAAVPSIISKEITDNLRTLLAETQVVIGQTEGSTRLPLPVDTPSNRPSSSFTFTETTLDAQTGLPLTKDTTASQERIHLCESSVITWVSSVGHLLSRCHVFGHHALYLRCRRSKSKLCCGRIRRSYSPQVPTPALSSSLTSGRRKHTT